MVLAMARPFKHPQTGAYWFRRAVPKDLRTVVGKREYLRSLRTKDPSQARTPHANVAAEVDKHWKALRSPAEPKSAIASCAVFAGKFGETIRTIGAVQTVATQSKPGPGHI